MSGPFRNSFTAAPEHIDVMGHVNNAVWVQWVQDMATAHWEAVADPAHVQAFVWLVTRHEIDYRGNVGAGETVTGETWISEPPKGARFWRNVRFTGADQKIKVEAKTSWAIIDRASQRPVRVPAELAALFLKTD